MVSDHAEKLLDIWDVLNGQTSIFFPRNTGREGLQMYWTAAVIRLFGTGYSFLSMKIGTAIAGLVTLPFLYLLGKELGSRRAGLLAMVLAGIAYWPNVITRVALRFTFYPLFVAPTLYFLIRGIRRSNRNDFILAGLSLGIGLHGYTPIRILPVVVVVAVALYLLHRQSSGGRKQAVLNLFLLAGVALVVFLPLLRFWVDFPELFSFRAFTRLGTIERPLPAPVLQIFLSNLWNALVMFSWSNGEIWPVSISYRPALDVVSAALFHLGVVLLGVRYLRRREWVDLFLILSIPLLLLPSILSLAFPSENPAPNRAAGAMVSVFLIAGIALDGLMSALESRRGARLAWSVGLALLLISSLQNFGLVFNQYQRDYTLLSWNTTEIGSVIRDFTRSLGEPDHAYVVAYPHWVDTRLVGINAGYPTRDYAIAPEQLSTTLEQPGPKLFVIYPQDESSMRALQLLYPQGYLRTYVSRVQGKDFWTYYVLPEQ
jgi:4-amino-4-deoxy-L-arabinose transferase-like glycosyltransferase